MLMLKLGEEQKYANRIPRGTTRTPRRIEGKYDGMSDEDKKRIVFNRKKGLASNNTTQLIASLSNEGKQTHLVQTLNCLSN